MSKRTAFLISTAILLVAMSPISADVLCVKHDDGALAVRQACKINETQVDPAALGLQGPPGPALTVRDRNGRFVGLLVDLVFERVARRVGDQTVLLDVGEAGFREFLNSLMLSHETLDCSGESFISPDPGIDDATLTRHARVFLRLQTAYFPVPPFSTRTIRSRVELLANPDYCTQTGGTVIPDGCCRRNDPFEWQLWSVGSLGLGEFAPPFHADGP